MRLVLLISITFHVLVLQLLEKPKEQEQTTNEKYYLQARRFLKGWEIKDESDSSDSDYGYLSGILTTIHDDLYLCGMDWKTEKFDKDIEQLRKDWNTMVEIDLSVHNFRSS